MKSYVISVSLCTGCYRHIQISAEATLFKLHKAILNAFEFEDDHAHAFFMDNRLWNSAAVYCYPKSEPGDFSSKSHKLEKFRLKKGDKFRYVFDFGASWEFQCKLLREVDEKTEIPRIVRSVGESPEQYPAYEEYAEEWEEDELSETECEEDTLEENGFPLLLPEEVLQSAFEIIPLPQETIRRIEKYFQAAARLYGILSVTELFALYNEQNKPVSLDDFLMVAEILRHKDHEEYEILGEEAFYTNVPKTEPEERKVVAEYLLVENNADAYTLLSSQQEGKPLKILPAKEFLRYADPLYTRETKQSKNMLKYLRRKEKSLKLPPEAMCEAIQAVIEVDCPLREVVKCMESEGWYFTGQKDILEFMKLYQDLNNHTRKHACRGYTPAELMDEKSSTQLEQLSLFEEPAAKPALTLVGKPSRNQPCPCGSGRKYKNCCGKNT